MKEMTHLQRLEAESIYILREVAAECEKSVMLYSAGKDSSVMLHLALKAFYPEKPPFPFLHIDTGWKFREMIAFRDEIVKKHGISMLVHRNKKGEMEHINPMEHGSMYTDVMKTEALKAALSSNGFQVAFGGGRRDEEISRAKERIFSVRSENHSWNPKKQRPELWNLYNTQINPKDSIRVFPLSNWTEVDIWEYIAQENIEIVPLYFAKLRPTVLRENDIIMLDDERFPLKSGEIPVDMMIRFRTLGCYPLTGAMKSTATTLEEILEETKVAMLSERSSRVIDYEGTGSMERRKREGYF